VYLLSDHNLHNAKNNLFFLESSLQEDPDTWNGNTSYIHHTWQRSVNFK